LNTFDYQFIPYSEIESIKNYEGGYLKMAGFAAAGAGAGMISFAGIAAVVIVILLLIALGLVF